jgi:hypothetical protein
MTIPDLQLESPTVTPTMQTETPVATATTMLTATPDITGIDVIFSLSDLSSVNNGIRVWIQQQQVDGSSAWVLEVDAWNSSPGEISFLIEDVQPDETFPIWIEYYYYDRNSPQGESPSLQLNYRITAQDEVFQSVPMEWLQPVDPLNDTTYENSYMFSEPVGQTFRKMASCENGQITLVPVYPGRSQMAADMNSIATGTGLLIQDGPTWNALTVASNHYDWKSSFTIDRYIDYSQTNGELWYRVNNGLDWWINARSHGYQYIWGVSDTANPCRFQSALRDIETITFSYSPRQTAIYAMAHAYRNSVPGGSNYPAGSNRVTSPLLNNNPPIPVYSGTVSNPFAPLIPYAFFEYPEQVTGEPGQTGSAMFTSQSFWMGGLPMTYDFSNISPEACPALAEESQTGWRYCNQTQRASYGWRDHSALVTYYSSFLNPIIDSDEGLLSRGRLARSEDEILQLNIVAGRITDGYPLLIEGSNKQQFFDQFIINNPGDFEEIERVQTGDYIFINRSRTNINGHGFLIAGWGEVTSCPDALNRIWNYASISDPGIEGQLFDTYRSGHLIVPYVVDFSGGISYTQLQAPRPRPFYCARHENPRSFILDDDYAFYGFPRSEVAISKNELYRPENWVWEVNQ